VEEELVEDLEGVGAVASAADGERLGAEFGVFFGEVGDAVWKGLNRQHMERAVSPLFCSPLPENCIDVTGADKENVFHRCWYLRRISRVLANPV
jgi:hypothetical protein